MGNWDKAPFMIGGGVMHSEQVARLVAYVAADGTQGVLTPTDLKVSQIDTPTGQVKIARGACAILNNVGSTFGEAYLARLPITDVVNIAPTTGTPRTDMVIARIEDPFQPGAPWSPPAPADLQTTEYVKTAVIANVGSATTIEELNLGYPAIALALVTLPASTTNVLNSHITDIRRLYNVKSSPDKGIVRSGTRRDLTAGAWTQWPNEFAALASFTVPWWANAMSLSVILGNVGFGASGSNSGDGWQGAGNLRVSFKVGGSTAGPGPASGWSLDSDTGIDRATLVAGARRISIPSAFKGKAGTVILEAQRTSGNAPLIWDGKSCGIVDIVWLQEAA